MKKNIPCSCGLPEEYAKCCGRWHQGAAAPTAEALMRARYSAYVAGDADYLLATWHPATRPALLDLDAGPAAQWIGLDIRRHQGIDAKHAFVEFVARYKVGGRAQRLHEVSRFVRESGRWYYVDGDILND